MIYIYDILLNFNNNYYEFYEWDNEDVLVHIKRIPLIKVNTDMINDVINNKVKVSNELLNTIYNKTELYKKNKTINYACLLTDSYKVIGILLDKDGYIIKISDLLLDEAEDTINISKKNNIVKIEYNILDNKNLNYYLTRDEINIKKYLLEELNNIYIEKDYDKLKYLYFEYCNKNKDDVNYIYKELKESLNNINDNHRRLYKLLTMTSNLTK